MIIQGLAVVVGLRPTCERPGGGGHGSMVGAWEVVCLRALEELPNTLKICSKHSKEICEPVVRLALHLVPPPIDIKALVM